MTDTTGRAPSPDRWRPLPVDPVAQGPPADPDEVARRILLDQLTGRARSRAELAGRLARKGVPAEVAERVLARFADVGLVDDAAFAQEWVRSRQAGRGLARRALAAELRRKGVGDADAAEALATVGADDEMAAARALVRRRLRGAAAARADPAVLARRLTAMLARRGYPPGTAFGAVREELRAGRPGSDDEAVLGDPAEGGR
jgi:regulatory protein